MAGESAPPLFTRNFILLCLSNLTLFASFYFLLATLPVYIVRIGGSEAEVGFIIGVFAATALVLRPFVGRGSDQWGRKRLILVGMAVMLLSSLLYTLTASTIALLAVRVLHGAGFATATTAAAAMVADILPPPRRGEGVGYYGMSMNVAMAAGPAVGVVLMNGMGFKPLFLLAALFALTSLILSLPLYEPRRPTPATANPSAPLLERSAFFPASVLGFLALTYGSIVSFLPLFAVRQGIANPGLFFTVYAIVVIVFRTPLGRLSDRYGRGASIIPGLALAAIALWVLSLATSLSLFLVVAFLYGLAFAAVQPALMALAIDRVNPAQRGAAMGTFTAAMDLGIGGGSFLWGFVAQAYSYAAMYQGAGVAALIAVLLYIVGSARRRSGRGRDYLRSGTASK